MSRSWTKQDKEYIFKENLEVKRREIEPIIYSIKSNLKYEIDFENIIDIILIKTSECPNFFIKTDLTSITNNINDEIDKTIKIVEKLYTYKQFYNSIIGNNLVDIYLNKYNNIIHNIKNYNFS